jgi:6-pyruvoyltetrahydropterin/6-carboxytetrahydropterin synthase
MDGGKVEVAKEFRFEASHVLPNHPGKCSNLHGHSWKLFVGYDGLLNDETGMVMDYATISKYVQPIVDELDHSHLGAWETDKVSISVGKTKSVSWLGAASHNPTSENLIFAIAKEIYKRGIKFSRIILNETENTCCILTWLEYLDMRGSEKK